MAPPRPPVLWPIAAPSTAPTAVLTPRSSAIAVDVTAVAAKITAPKHFLFNMAFPLTATRTGMITDVLGHDSTIAFANRRAIVNTESYKSGKVVTSPCGFGRAPHLGNVDFSGIAHASAPRHRYR